MARTIAHACSARLIIKIGEEGVIGDGVPERARRTPLSATPGRGAFGGGAAKLKTNETSPSESRPRASSPRRGSKKSPCGLARPSLAGESGQLHLALALVQGQLAARLLVEVQHQLALLVREERTGRRQGRERQRPGVLLAGADRDVDLAVDASDPR